LVPGERIVQSWRTTQFTDEHEDSIITVTLEPVEGGTLLTLIRSNVPGDHKSYEQGGWQKHYFGPMLVYFSTADEAMMGEEAADSPAPPPPKPAVPPAPKPQRARK